MMKEFLGNSYLFGANAPFIEELYETYLEDPQSVEPRWRDYFDELQRARRGAAPRTSRTRRSSKRFVAAREARQLGRSARPPTGAQLGAQAGRGAAADHRVPHRAAARWRDARSAQAPGEAAHPRARAGVLRPDRSRHGHGVQHRHRSSGPERRCARHPAGAEGHLLRHASASSTCTSPTRAQKRWIQERLEPVRVDAAAHAPSTRSTSSSASPRPRPRALPAHALRRPEALLAGRRRER